MTIKGTKHNDVLHGTAGKDTFDLSQGGNDTAYGGGGNDIFKMGRTLNAADRLSGGSGSDTVILKGNYGAGLTFAAKTITGIEALTLTGKFNYKLTTNDGNVAKGKTLAVNAGALNATHALTFNGAAEKNGRFDITGGHGNDTLTGGTRADTFHLEKGGRDTAHGGKGNDTFSLGSTLTAADRIDGGANADTMVLKGHYGLTLHATTMTNIETLRLTAGFDYRLTTNDANVAAGATLKVDAHTLHAGDNLVFNGGAETNGAFVITSGGGNDHLTGGAKNDTVTAGGGNDTIDLSHGGNDTAYGGDGIDFFVMGGAFNAGDALDGGTGNDRLLLNGDYSGAHKVAMHAATLTNVEEIDVSGGHSYNLKSNDTTVAAGETFSINATGLGAGDSLIFNGSGETDGHFLMGGGAGHDALTGGALSDTFDITTGGNDRVNGGAGNDAIYAGSHFNAGDAIDGGADTDTLYLDGDYSGGVTFGTNTLTNVEDLNLAAGHTYSFTASDGTVTSGESLVIDASALAAANHLSFDGSAETDGGFTFTTGAGDDVLSGGGYVDSFNLEAGGHDTVHAGGGDDTIRMGASLDALDVIDGGGGGIDTLRLDGDYSAGVVFGTSTVTNFKNFELVAGHSYNFTASDGTVASGDTMNVLAASLAAGQNLTFDGSAEADGGFSFDPGAGDDELTGGGQTDVFSLGTGGNDTANGGGGYDFFFVGAALNASDHLDGGDGGNDLILTGDYAGAHAIVFGATTVVNIDIMEVSNGFDYDITTDDATVASGQSLTVQGDALTGGHTLTFDGSAEADGAFILDGGAGNDVLIGGSGGDNFNGGGGADTFTLGSGSDTVTYSQASESASTNFDTVIGFDANNDSFNTPVSVTAVGSGSGSISAATFDTDMGNAISDSLSGHASVVTATGGDYAGLMFLVIDADNNGDYDDGTDYVIDVTGHNGVIVDGTFI